MPWGGALAKPYLARLPEGSTAFSCSDYDDTLPGSDVKNFFQTLNKNKLKNNSIENIMYAYLASMQNRNAIMFARKNTEPLNLLNCLMNAQGKPLTPKQITKIKAEFESLFPKKTLDIVIKKFANDGEYNMYAKEIGCAMAITYLVYKNSLAELNYNRYPKHNSRLQLDIEPIEIGMWGRNGRI